LSETGVLASCAVLAIPHGGLSEGIRSLLATAFSAVVMVADEQALLSCVESLSPTLVVVDLAMAPGRGPAIVARLHADRPGLRLIALGGDDDPTMQRAALAAGAGRYLLKRSLGTDLMVAVDDLLLDAENSDR
jgi:DNA-binding NarL/FixJ family response regulator